MDVSLRIRLAAVALSAALAACASLPETADTPALLERARAIHSQVLTLDTHVDIDPAHFGTGLPNYVSGIPSNQVDLPKMEQGGLRAAFFSSTRARSRTSHRRGTGVRMTRPWRGSGPFSA